MAYTTDRLTAGQANKRLDALRAKADRLEAKALAATEDLQGPGIPMFDAYAKRADDPNVAAFLAAWNEYQALLRQVKYYMGSPYASSMAKGTVIPNGY